MRLCAHEAMSNRVCAAPPPPPACGQYFVQRQFVSCASVGGRRAASPPSGRHKQPPSSSAIRRRRSYGHPGRRRPAGQPAGSAATLGSRSDVMESCACRDRAWPPVSAETFCYINPRLPTQLCNTRMLDLNRLAEGERPRRQTEEKTMGSRMFALLMAVAFTGGIIASPVAFAQGRGGQGGAGMGLRTQTMGPTQTAPSGSGPGKCRSRPRAMQQQRRCHEWPTRGRLLPRTGGWRPRAWWSA